MISRRTARADEQHVCIAPTEGSDRVVPSCDRFLSVRGSCDGDSSERDVILAEQHDARALCSRTKHAYVGSFRMKSCDPHVHDVRRRRCLLLVCGKIRYVLSGPTFVVRRSFRHRVDLSSRRHGLGRAVKSPQRRFPAHVAPSRQKSSTLSSPIDARDRSTALVLQVLYVFICLLLFLWKIWFLMKFTSF